MDLTKIRVNLMKTQILAYMSGPKCQRYNANVLVLADPVSILKFYDS